MLGKNGCFCNWILSSYWVFDYRKPRYFRMCEKILTSKRTHRVLVIYYIVNVENVFQRFKLLYIICYTILTEWIKIIFSLLIIKQVVKKSSGPQHRPQQSFSRKANDEFADVIISCKSCLTNLFRFLPCKHIQMILLSHEKKCIVAFFYVTR